MSASSDPSTMTNYGALLQWDDAALKKFRANLAATARESDKLGRIHDIIIRQMFDPTYFALAGIQMKGVAIQGIIREVIPQRLSLFRSGTVSWAMLVEPRFFLSKSVAFAIDMDVFLEEANFSSPNFSDERDYLSGWGRGLDSGIRNVIGAMSKAVIFKWKDGTIYLPDPSRTPSVSTARSTQEAIRNAYANKSYVYQNLGKPEAVNPLRFSGAIPGFHKQAEEQCHTLRNQSFRIKIGMESRDVFVKEILPGLICKMLLRGKGAAPSIKGLSKPPSTVDAIRELFESPVGEGVEAAVDKVDPDHEERMFAREYANGVMSMICAGLENSHADSVNFLPSLMQMRVVEL